MMLGLRLAISDEHRRWLDEQARALRGWPWLLGLATAVMLVLPTVLPSVWTRMAVVNASLSLLLLGLYRRVLGPLLRPSATAVAVGLACAVVLYVGADLFMAGLRSLAPALAEQVERVYAWSDDAPLFVRLALLFVIVPGEDLVWRGAVTLPLCARCGPWWGCLLAGTVFALAHLTSGPPLLVIAALAMGTLWSILAVRTRSLVPVVVSHLAWDLAVMFVRPL
jgi:membrane protease YdiL (CAAX protease family)